MKLITKRKAFQILFWIWLVFLFVFSSVPNIPDIEKEIIAGIRTDYLIHFLQFFVLSSLFIYSEFRISPKNHFRLILLFALCITGVINEFYQLLIPGRSFNWIDMLFNIIGSVFGLIIVGLLMKRFSNRKV